MSKKEIVSIYAIIYPKPVSKPLDLAEGTASIRFKNGAYTLVREYFESNCNTALGQEMRVLKLVLDVAAINMYTLPRNPSGCFTCQKRHGVRYILHLPDAAQSGHLSHLLNLFF